MRSDGSETLSQPFYLVFFAIWQVSDVSVGFLVSLLIFAISFRWFESTTLCMKKTVRPKAYAVHENLQKYSQSTMASCEITKTKPTSTRSDGAKQNETAENSKWNLFLNIWLHILCRCISRLTENDWWQHDDITRTLKKVQTQLRHQINTRSLAWDPAIFRGNERYRLVYV